MTGRVIDRIGDIADQLREQSWEAERIGRLTDETVKLMKAPAGRRTQVRAVWRAVSAVDEIFARSGGNAARMDEPLQGYWRDVHVGQAHAIHVPGIPYHASALSSFGVDPQGPLRAMI